MCTTTQTLLTTSRSSLLQSSPFTVLPLLRPPPHQLRALLQLLRLLLRCPLLRLYPLPLRQCHTPLPLLLLGAVVASLRMEWSHRIHLLS